MTPEEIKAKYDELCARRAEAIQLQRSLDEQIVELRGSCSHAHTDPNWITDTIGQNICSYCGAVTGAADPRQKSTQCAAKAATQAAKKKGRLTQSVHE